MRSVNNTQRGDYLQFSDPNIVNLKQVPKFSSSKPPIARKISGMTQIGGKASELKSKSS